MKCGIKTNINLSCNSFCFSIDPWRQSFLRRIFAERGLQAPRFQFPIRVSAPTRAGEPPAYSGLALNFIHALLQAHETGLSYCILFEDDAFPCSAPQVRLDSILSAHPLPEDCGILCMGDINGVSRFRGKQTLLLHQCEAPYTRLIPGKAENKGSHALVVFQSAFIPFAQAISSCGVTDLAISRICNYSNLHAYSLFYSPLFTQHNYRGSASISTPHRLPEFFVARRLSLLEQFPEPSRQTSILLPRGGRFLVFSNAPNKSLEKLNIRPDDIFVFINKAVDFDKLKTFNNKRILFSRSNANRRGSWFLPPGQEDLLPSLYDDFLLLSDEALSRERPWYKEYRAATGGKVPSTGWITYRILTDDLPGAEVLLVGFNPAGDTGSFKWPRHAWSYEADYYRRHAVSILNFDN